MYKFSAPMPYSKEAIDRIIDINNQVEKSKITSLYASLPPNCNLFTGFEQLRNINFKQSDFYFWKDLFVYTLEKNVDFIYLLNNPLPFDLRNKSFNIQIEKLNKLLIELNKIGVQKIRIANLQLSSYIGKYYKNFSILASTSLDYKSISEYQNLIKMHPELKQIVPSHDINKNFKLLKNLRKNYPHLEIEIMVNEGCIKGCPHRYLHENITYDNSIKEQEELFLSPKYCITMCYYIIKKYPFHSLTINNNIFPWEIKEYSKLGINNFKLVGRDGYTVKINKCIREYLSYLKFIDRIEDGIKDEPIVTFINQLTENNILQQLTIKDVKKYLPDINHFKKYGHLCASRCGVECRYCYKCAEKIQKVFEKKMREKEKQPHFVPACTMET